MIKKFILCFAIILLSICSLWARVTAVVEREFDAFRAKAPVNLNVGKAEQFLEELTKREQVDDIIAILNKGEGVRGFSKKNRKLTDQEAKIALNALFFAKQRSSGVFPFYEKINSFGSAAVQRHRHFVKVAWRLLDPTLGYVKAGTNFQRDDRAYREFKDLVHAHMRIGSDTCELDNYSSTGFGDYFTYGVGTTKQSSHKIPTVPHFHAYHYFSPPQGISKRPTTTIRFRLPTSEMRQHLPEGIRGKISHIPNENLEIFVLSQDLPWPDDKDILYRPHYWLDPNAPYKADGYNHNFEVSLSSFPSVAQNTIPREEGPITQSLNTHTNSDPQVLDNVIVSSPPTPVAAMLTPEKRRENFSFYTLTTVNSILDCTPPAATQSPGRYALTLHLILNKDTQEKLSRFLKIDYYELWKAKARAQGAFSPLNIPYAIPVYQLSELLDDIPELRQLYPFGF